MYHDACSSTKLKMLDSPREWPSRTSRYIIRYLSSAYTHPFLQPCTGALHLVREATIRTNLSSKFTRKLKLST